MQRIPCPNLSQPRDQVSDSWKLHPVNFVWCFHAHPAFLSRYGDEGDNFYIVALACAIVFVAWMLKPHHWFVPVLCKEFWTILVTTSLNRCMHGVMAGQAWKVRHFRLPQDSAGRPTHGLQENSKLVQTLCIHITLSVLGFMVFSTCCSLFFNVSRCDVHDSYMQCSFWSCFC